MDTKLKNISRNPITKSIAFIIVIIFITVISLQLSYIKYANLNTESIVEKDYKNSKAFGNEVNKAINDTYKLLETKGDNRIRNINYSYLVKDKNKILTNTNNYNKGFYEEYKDAFFAYEKGKYRVGENTSTSLVKSFPGKIDYTMYIAYSDAFLLDHNIFNIYMSNDSFVIVKLFNISNWQEIWNRGIICIRH